MLYDCLRKIMFRKLQKITKNKNKNTKINWITYIYKFDKIII